VETVEVLVVGGGPAGSTVAYELARTGHQVLVIEEHPRIGYPVQCAGLVSQRVLDLAGSTQFVLRPIHGATVLSPSLQSLSFRAHDPRAFVINRAGLDIYLAKRAAQAGARIEPGWKFERRESSGAEGVDVRLTGTDGTTRALRTSLVIGADGVASAVARSFRLRRPVEILPAFEAEFTSSAGDPDQVEVYLGNEVSPGLFGWWIPDGAGGARVGVASRADGTPARKYYDRLVQQVNRLHGATLPAPSGFLVSGIPIGTVPRTHDDRVLLVGDAAAQVKPLSGGGIFTGMRCAQIAAEVAHSALRQRNVSRSGLAPYDLRWRAEFGEEFSKALYLRRLFLRLSDSDLEAVLEALRSSAIESTIVAFGDIDFPTHVARSVLRQSPSLVRLFPKALGALLSSGELRAPDLDPGPLRNA
jgi:digeranylgeranylglycerophospholipid reductase